MDCYDREDIISSHSDNTPMEIRTDIQRDFDADASYYRSWKRNELALKEIQGSWEEAYDLFM